MASTNENQQKIAEFLRYLRESTSSEELKNAIEIGPDGEIDLAKVPSDRVEELLEIAAQQGELLNGTMLASSICQTHCRYTGVANPADPCHTLCGPGYRRRDS